MFSSQKVKTDLILLIYQDVKTVFRLSDIAMIAEVINFQSLNKKLNYLVHKGRLLNPRKGIYAKPNYNKEELAGCVFTPSYISLEYVLQKAGVIFQYDPRVTSVSYLSRTIEVESITYSFRKLKGELLVNTTGIIRQNNMNIATPERAFLDTLYLNKDYYFDNLNPLNKEMIIKLLPIYQSESFSKKVAKLFRND
ncbi:MAG: hypothetical protein COW85_03855 [Ignavibacteria bacterium CG22_combo_CG10-13_8_21_14_all_37_15]|nr:hypothetical protein [Bacteroidota bacterium]PIP78528.1 MAG: hypothetical protein COW85_03855 [Ignavibacteria bacterium CG22_combo_CG10-13_8_21_14_all_37_15]PJA04611.1 MAG: hypothetical protein COX71_10925 [Flavobacteriales bacterium CG_4_10_14_0_2_um_filter_35_18]